MSVRNTWVLDNKFKNTLIVMQSMTAHKGVYTTMEYANILTLLGIVRRKTYYKTLK